jgi:hypothetical protein
MRSRAPSRVSTRIFDARCRDAAGRRSEAAKLIRFIPGAEKIDTRADGGARHHTRSFQGAEVFGYAGEEGSAHRDRSIKQLNKKAFSTQRNKEERLSARGGKDFGAWRKRPTKHRAKRNHLPTPWTRSSFLVPL